LTECHHFLTLKVRKIVPYQEAAMIVAKVTSKGQITLPKKVRDKLGVRPGEDVGFEEKKGVIMIKKAVTKSPFDKWVGKLTKLKGQCSDDLVKELRGH
jgi:AbrB family looped-hinge helix DNA binding protein